MCPLHIILSFALLEDLEADLENFGMPAVLSANYFEQCKPYMYERYHNMSRENLSAMAEVGMAM